MFSAFNLEISENDLKMSSGYEEGRILYNSYRKQISDSLDKYLLRDGTIDVNKIEKDWFPEIKADIFISHSHADEHLAITLSGWLFKNYKIKCFIDSCVWGYANDLLRNIDNEYCVGKRDENDKILFYSYEMRNDSTSHVHMILNGALMKMIDNTECFMFLSTPNSLILKKEITNNSTYSPWIYSELLFSKLVRHKKLYEYRKKSSIEMKHYDQHITMKYDVDMSHMETLNAVDLFYVADFFTNKNKYDFLDNLYSYKGILKQNG